MIKQHWEDVYSKKKCNEVSWYQENPRQSINLIQSTKLGKSCAIIDIGGGDSFLADRLMKLRYKNITVLDISSNALRKVEKRIAEKAKNINFIKSNVLKFSTDKRFDIWHDRATFHFLTRDKDIKKYVKISSNLIKPDGYLIISTFSTKGPKKCSSLNIKQYTKNSMTRTFEKSFKLIKAFHENHITPFSTKQNFIWCVFRRG